MRERRSCEREEKFPYFPMWESDEATNTGRRCYIYKHTLLVTLSLTSKERSKPAGSFHCDQSNALDAW